MHSMAEIAPMSTNEAQLFLAFSLAGQDYAVPITQVQEIREWSKVTPLPNSPAHVKGVLNMRGTIVPIVDMRLRFQLVEKKQDALTVIVVVNVGGRLAGLVVDSVSDVITIGSSELCSMSEIEGQANRPFIAGLAQVNGQLLILLDVEKLLNPEDLTTGVAVSA
jgi:purine-binding chemotaxis protein CheW